MKLVHGRTGIELYRLGGGEDGPALLLLHEAGGSAEDWASGWHAWPGPVYALDFAGHGRSERLAGSGYTAEYFMADADVALEEIAREVVLVGAGLGGYVALLLAGARPDDIPAALLLAGRGLAGGGNEPSWEDPSHAGIEGWEARVAADAARYREGTDPLVSECEHDLRPLDYIEPFAADARRIFFGEEVAGADQPPWWDCARNAAGGESGPADPAQAIALLHGARGAAD